MFERAGGWCVQGEERETLVVGEVAGCAAERDAECSARRVHAGRVALANEVEGRLSCPPAPAVWASATADVLAAAAQVALPCAQLLQQGLPPRVAPGIARLLASAGRLFVVAHSDPVRAAGGAPYVIVEAVVVLFF